jgi:hypothetical protein
MAQIGVNGPLDGMSPRLRCFVFPRAGGLLSRREMICRAAENSSNDRPQKSISK